MTPGKDLLDTGDGETISFTPGADLSGLEERPVELTPEDHTRSAALGDINLRAFRRPPVTKESQIKRGKR